MKILIILNKFNREPYLYEKDYTKKNYTYLMPIGLASISAVLKKEGYDVSILNLNHREGLIKDIIHEELTKTHYDVIFTGGVSIYYPNIRDYIIYIRESSPNTKVILGGGLITAQPEIMFHLLKPDFIIIGEGEETAIELVNCIKNNGDFSKIKGIGYKQNNIFIRNRPREPIKDLDNLPYPDFDAFEFDEFIQHTLPTYIVYDNVDYPRVYPVLASRSCPFSCTFCFHTIGNKYRQRSIKSIIDEIKYAVEKYKTNIFFFYDELFAYDRERALEFCRQLKEFVDTVPYKIYFNLNLRVDCADEEIIDAMKSVGCTPIGLGLESYSQTILNSMRKHTTPEQIYKTLKMISDKNLASQGAFIFGDEAETLETAKETLDFLNNHQDIIRGGIQIGFIIPFQGSPIYNSCVKRGIIKNEIEFIENRAKNGYNFYNPENLTHMSDSEFEKLKDKVFTAFYTSGHYSVPIMSTIKNGIHEIHIKCPYCHKISILKNIQRPNILELPNVGCRHCNGRFKLVDPLYPFIRIILLIFGFNRVYKTKKVIDKIKSLCVI